MLNRSKLVIDVEPFIFPQTFAFMSCSKAACRTEVAVKRPRQLISANVGGTPRRTASFPNGDVRQPQTPVRFEVPAKPLEVHRARTVTRPARFAAQTIPELPNRCNGEALPSLGFGSAVWGITEVGDHARQGLVCDECRIQADRRAVARRSDESAVVADVAADPR